MPVISIDTFFACSLMVLLTLSAMAASSKLLYPYINNAVDVNSIERFREASKYMLLSEGSPADWGQRDSTILERFGLARAGSDAAYELDIDKVSRLNDENSYAVPYAQIFEALKMSDVSFRLEVKPLFEVSINLTSTFNAVNETIYQFEISTQRHGAQVPASLKCYAVTSNYFNVGFVGCASGQAYVNVTLPNNIGGPALLAVLAKANSNTNVVSFNAYGFAHNSAQPKQKGTFLKLGPLNYTLTASTKYPNINLSEAYALAFNYNSTLTKTTGNDTLSTYNIPRILDSSPTLLVVTGENSTAFFAEWTAYPQIPVEVGANFANPTTIALTNVFAYPYIITIGSAFYECTVWIGGPRG